MNTINCKTIPGIIGYQSGDLFKKGDNIYILAQLFEKFDLVSLKDGGYWSASSVWSGDLFEYINKSGFIFYKRNAVIHIE